jgi:hypothetical protein
MGESARIDSIAELRAFRVALIKFVDACNVALGDAESDMQRTHQWVERDQLAYWNGQLAKRAELVARAKEAVRMKKLYKSPTGSTQSVVEEEKALRKAIALHEEAGQKIVACKQWARRLQKEIMLYKGGVTRFTSTLGGDVPRALARLDAMASSLEAYATLAAGGGAGAAGTSGGMTLTEALAAGSMSRSPDEAGATHDPFGGLDIAALRDNVPPPDVRIAAPAADIREEKWTGVPVLSNDERKAVVDLRHVGPPLGNNDLLTVAKGSWSAGRVYLIREPAAGPGDTGWYLAPTDLKGIMALNRVPVRDLLEVRGDFRELLTLPDAFLVVLDDKGIRSIFTPTGDDLWTEKRLAESSEAATG